MSFKLLKTRRDALRRVRNQFAVLASAICVAPAPSLAAIVDLGGGTVEITTADGLNTYKNNEVQNGVLNVSASQAFADGTFTFGYGLVINQTAGAWGTSGSRTVKIVDGCVVRYTSTEPVWFGRTHGGVTYNGTTQLILDNGTFEGGSAEFGFPHALASNSGGYNKNVVVNLLMNNGSSLSTTSDIKFGEVQSGNSRKETTIKITAAITNSTITAKAVRFGQANSYISDLANSFVDASFGPGSDVSCYQFYAYQYPQATVTFDGTTVHWLGNDSNVFGKNGNAANFEGYRLLSGGVTLDLSQDMTHGSAFAALIGEGGFTKIGTGTLTYERDAFKFTGPLTVSNGVMISSQSMAASAFAVDGASSELRLSGALTNANVTLSATAGGTLTLAGASLSDASPALTLAGGGSTDYFTRDGAVAAYALDSLALGAGAVLNLDADATGVDAISVATTNIAATAANPVVINLNFLTAPAAGQTIRLFETDDAAKFTVNPRLGGMTVPHEMSVADGFLVMTVTADDYTWKGTLPNWGDADAWTKGGADATWADGNNAIFATPGATAALAANVAASKVDFRASATVSGSATLAASEVSVASDVSATISAPTAGTMLKTGAGTLTLGASRTDQTTLSEGTLKMANGATVDPAKFMLGTDVTKPVTFDYGGQTLTIADPRSYLGDGMNITFTNGTFASTGDVTFNNAHSLPSVITVAKDAVFSTSDGRRFSWNVGAATQTVNVVGGTIRGGTSNNYFMQDSRTGRLDINITEGGLLEFNGETYMQTCQDGTDDYQSPELHIAVVDSTFSVKNSKSVNFGRNSATRASATPIFTLAATNSLIDIAWAIFLGNDKSGLATGGAYTADFENCVITSRYCYVLADRPRNAIRFNNTRFVANTSDMILIRTADAFDTMGAGGTAIKPITVGADGLVIDTNGKNVSLGADLQGGAVTKTGAGKLTIEKSQTASAALTVNEGALALNGALTLNRATTVKGGTTFTVNATARSTVSDIAFEDGTTLDIANYTPGAYISVASLALPASGTVALTYGGAAFPKGVYGILSKTGLTVADVANLVPSTGGLPYTWSVVDGLLVLNVDGVGGNAWTGLAGDRKMSTGGNWLTGVAPVAGDTLDFSCLAASTTIIADMGETVFNTVDLGTLTKGAVTIDGTLHLATLTVDQTDVNLSVGENSKLIVDGDVTLTYTGSSSKSNIYVVYENRGEVEVRGRVVAAGKSNPYPCYDCSEGATISAKGLYNGSTVENFKLNAQKASAPMVNWIMGSDGLVAENAARNFWVERIDGDTTSAHSASIKAAADFSIDAMVAARKQFDLDTGAGYTITINGQVYYVPGTGSANPMTVSGSGKVVCNYTQPNSNKYNGLVTVTNTATLAVNPGKVATVGAITVATNATLEVAQSGTVALGGNLTLNDGAVLGFNFTERRTTPVLDLTGKAVAFGSQSNVVVKVSAADGIRAKSGANVLTAGGKFAGATVSLADGAPDWVKGVSVVDGDIVLDAKRAGFVVIVK